MHQFMHDWQRYSWIKHLHTQRSIKNNKRGSVDFFHRLHHQVLCFAGMHEEFPVLLITSAGENYETESTPNVFNHDCINSGSLLVSG